LASAPQERPEQVSSAGLGLGPGVASGGVGPGPGRGVLEAGRAGPGGAWLCCPALPGCSLPGFAPGPVAGAGSALGAALCPRCLLLPELRVGAAWREALPGCSRLWPGLSAPPSPGLPLLPSPPLRSALPGGGCALSFGKLRAATVAGAGRAGAWKATAAGAERRCSVEEAGCVGEGGGCRGVSEGGKPLPCGERVTGSPALPPAAGTLGAVEPGRLAGCLEHEVPAVQWLNAGAGGWGPEVLHPNSEQDSHVMWWPSMSPPGPWC